MSTGLALTAKLLQVLGIECSHCSCLPAAETELLSVRELDPGSSIQYRRVFVRSVLTEGLNSRLENVVQVFDSKPCKVKTRDVPWCSIVSESRGVLERAMMG